MKLTDEQYAILGTNDNIVINAVAGSGKTTTLIEYALTRLSNKRILYLAFNKTVKIEAEQKFAAAGLRNVTVETAHSLAFNYIVKGSNYTITPGYKTYELVDILEIVTGERHVDYMIASHVNRFISYFCNSTAARVQELNYLEVVAELKARQFVENYYSVIEYLTRQALAKMHRAEISIIHDFYLKKFQLNRPVLPYDYILFDEGQDASSAMLDVFLQQPAIKIIVGDVHQQIYGWRFAINSLLKTDFPFYNLSKSFRFNRDIAAMANKILDWKSYLQQPPTVEVQGVGKGRGKIKTRAILARTNLSLLTSAITQWQDRDINKVYFEGRMSSYMFADGGASLYDVLNLYNGKPDMVRDKLIAGMKNMDELEDYIEKTEENGLSAIVDVVKEYGNDLPKFIARLKENEVENKEDADMIFSTVHRCKGMEYDAVTLLNDFITEEKLKRFIGEKMDENRLVEEINILYVAVTRAKIELNMPAPRPARRIEKKSGAGNQGKYWSANEDQELTDLFHAGLNARQIAAQLERSPGGVQMRLQKLGLMGENDYLDYG
jgi:Superfamily I DNA and RNA helicases